MKSWCGLLGFALAGACAAPTSKPAPEPPTPTTNSSTQATAAPPDPAPVPATSAASSAGSPPAPAPEQQKATAKLELRVPFSVVLGDSIPIELVNVDDHDHAFWLPAAPNGCKAFRFEVTFTNKGGTTYREDRSSQVCSQAFVPARWLVIEKGSSSKLLQPTDMPVLAGSAKPAGFFGPPRPPLRPGSYTMTVTGADISVSAPITLVAKKK